MKLASLKASRPGGTLLVVSADLTLCQTVGGIAPSLAQAVADWQRVAPQLEEVYTALSGGHARHAQAFDPRLCQPLEEGRWWVSVAECGTIRLAAAPGEHVAVSPEDLPTDVRAWLKRTLASGRM